MISSLLQKNNFRRKPFMEKSNSKKFFLRSAVKNFAEEDFWKIKIAETITDNENENLSDPSADTMSVKFQKTIKHIRQMKYQKLKFTTVNLINATQGISKIVSEYFQFSNGFLIFQKFSRSVENGWIEKLVSDSDLKILQNCKIKGWGDFTSKRFCISFRYTKSLLATPLRLLFFRSAFLVYLKSNYDFLSPAKK